MTRAALVQVDPPGPRLDFDIMPETMERTGREPRLRSVERDGRDDAREWAGRSAWQWRFTLVFDAAHQLGDPQAAVDGLGLAQLRRWHGEYGAAKRPPLLRWEFGNAEFEPVLLRRAVLNEQRGNRNRQLAHRRAAVDVELVEWQEPTAVIDPLERRAATGDGEPQQRPERIHTVAAGDTLWGIAQSQLGDGARWREIADLNDLDDPDLIHPGDQLRLPER